MIEKQYTAPLKYTEQNEVVETFLNFLVQVYWQSEVTKACSIQIIFFFVMIFGCVFFVKVEGCIFVSMFQTKSDIRIMSSTNCCLLYFAYLYISLENLY